MMQHFHTSCSQHPFDVVGLHAHCMLFSAPRCHVSEKRIMPRRSPNPSEVCKHYSLLGSVDNRAFFKYIAHVSTNLTIIYADRSIPTKMHE